MLRLLRRLLWKARSRLQLLRLLRRNRMTRRLLPLRLNRHGAAKRWRRSIRYRSENLVRTLWGRSLRQIPTRCMLMLMHRRWRSIVLLHYLIKIEDDASS